MFSLAYALFAFSIFVISLLCSPLPKSLFFGCQFLQLPFACSLQLSPYLHRVSIPPWLSLCVIFDQHAGSLQPPPNLHCCPALTFPFPPPFPPPLPPPGFCCLGGPWCCCEFGCAYADTLLFSAQYSTLIIRFSTWSSSIVSSSRCSLSILSCSASLMSSFPARINCFTHASSSGNLCDLSIRCSSLCRSLFASLCLPSSSLTVSFLFCTKLWSGDFIFQSSTSLSHSTFSFAT